MPSPAIMTPTYDTVGRLRQWTTEEQTPLCGTPMKWSPSSLSRIVAISHSNHTLVIFKSLIEWEIHHTTGAHTWNHKLDLKQVQLYVANYMMENAYAIEVSTHELRTFFLCPSSTARESWLNSLIHGGATLITCTGVPPGIPHSSVIIGKQGWLLKKGWFQTWERRFYRTVTIDNFTYLSWADHIDSEIQTKDDILLSHDAVQSVAPCCEIPPPPYVLRDSFCEFQVTLTKRPKKLYLRADSIAERDSWMHVLRILAHGQDPHSHIQVPLRRQSRVEFQSGPSSGSNCPRAQRSASLPCIISPALSSSSLSSSSSTSSTSSTSSSSISSCLDPQPCPDPYDKSVLEVNFCYDKNEESNQHMHMTDHSPSSSTSSLV